MGSFYDYIIKWQPFFATVATVAAALAGLLFVSLSLNRERITARENHLLLGLARRSFADFLFAMFIGLMFLIPNHEPFGLAIPLFILSAFRGQWLMSSILHPKKAPGEKLAGLRAFREHSFQTISFLCLLFAGIEIWRRQLLAIFLLVPVIALLLANATMNAWLLLILEKKAEEKASEPMVKPTELVEK